MRFESGSRVQKVNQISIINIIIIILILRQKTKKKQPIMTAITFHPRHLNCRICITVNTIEVIVKIMWHYNLSTHCFILMKPQTTLAFNYID